MLIPENAELDVASKVEVVVMVEPKGKARPRAVVRVVGDRARGGVAPDKADKEWRKRFKAATVLARMQLAPKIKALRGKPLRFELELYFQKPKVEKSWFCNSSTDNDNSEKNVWDALLDETAKKVVGTRIIKEVIEGFIQDDHYIITNETMKDWAKGAPFIVFRIYALKRRP